MIVSLFGRKKENANEKIVNSTYSAVVEAGRTPVFYSHWGVPDTPIGRYEAIGLHMILFLHRTRSTNKVLEELAQDVLDEFFLELDHSIRELGVGDAGVPKRMKKLGKMFYGRMGPYWTALDAGDASELAAALRRNIVPDTPEAMNGEALAAYMLESVIHLKSVTDEQLLAGQLNFKSAPEQV